MANLWRKEAFYWLVKGFEDGKFNAPEVALEGKSILDNVTLASLNTFKERHGFQISDATAEKESFSDVIAKMFESNSSLVTTDEGKRIASRILHAVTSGDMPMDTPAQLDSEMVQQQEQHQDVTAELQVEVQSLEEDTTSRHYSRDSEEPCPWP
eukprot:GDKJ01043935.1.p1 GENE.GDKJ01043935.1~~GDKJ01043935.1.p1  ORF type:complete len:154 (-),score=10.22 GDKJ01043935.1:15-476(-)